MIIRMYATDGLKGQQAHSPGHRPGYSGQVVFALKGQKRFSWASSSAVTYEGDAVYAGFCPYRACLSHGFSQGDALGYVLIAPSGRYRVHADNH